jgi:solute:Na+ symporter, SSS family
LLLGLLPAFKSSGPLAAIASIAAGIITFICTKNIQLSSLALEVGLPTMVSALVYVITGQITKAVPDKVTNLMTALKRLT